MNAIIDQQLDSQLYEQPTITIPESVYYIDKISRTVYDRNTRMVVGRPLTIHNEE